MRFILKLIIVAVISLCSVRGYAQSQSIGDRLFAQGQKLQLVQTVKSQNLAIGKFQAARKAYDSASKKSMCDNQIAICRSNIKTLNQKQTARKGKVRRQKTEEVVEKDTVAVAPKVEKEPVSLQLSVSYMEFKASGKAVDRHEVLVSCNYDNWTFSAPDWVQVAKNGNILILTVSSNKTSDERKGKLSVTCDDKTAEMVISQKCKLLKSLLGKKKK